MAEKIYRFGMSKRDFDLREKDKLEYPGPDKYDTRESFGSDAPKISMTFKPKTKEMGKKKDEPGPGEYKHPRQGYLSKEDNLLSFKFGGEKRFREKLMDDGPGPGEHIDIFHKPEKGKQFSIQGKLDEKNRYFSKHLYKSESIAPGPQRYQHKDGFHTQLRSKPASVWSRDKSTRYDIEKEIRRTGQNEFGLLQPEYSYDLPLNTKGGYMERSKRDVVMIDTKESEKIFFGTTGPGPIYTPKFKIVEKRAPAPLLRGKDDDTVRSARRFFKPGPGNYNPSHPDWKWTGPDKGVTLTGKEREVHDIFTNSKRKARFLNKSEPGIFSPGPKYLLRENIGTNGPSFTFAKAGEKKKRKRKGNQKKRRLLIIDEFGEIQENVEVEDEEDDSGKFFGGKGEKVGGYGSGPIYHPKHKLVEKSPPKVGFTKGKRFRQMRESDVPGPGFYTPSDDRLSQKRTVLVPKIQKNSNGKKFRPMGGKKGVDSPGVARYFANKSTLGKKGTSFGLMKSIQFDERKKKGEYKPRYPRFWITNKKKKKGEQQGKQRKKQS